MYIRIKRNPYCLTRLLTIESMPDPLVTRLGWTLAKIRIPIKVYVTKIAKETSSIS